MRSSIDVTIHEDDPIVLNVMSVKDPAAFDPIERDVSGRVVTREIILGNIIVRIFEP